MVLLCDLRVHEMRKDTVVAVGEQSGQFMVHINDQKNAPIEYWNADNPLQI